MGEWPARPRPGDERKGRSALEWVELAVALVVILFAAELFTNGVEWIGENLGLSEGVVGSVLAAVGTALPETLLPLVAILIGHEAGKEIGIGAILGAPFMLSTLAMFVVGVAVLILARNGGRPTDLHGDRRVLLQDLGYFLAMYTLALVAGLFHPKWFKWLLAASLIVGYALYVKRHFQSPGETVKEAAGEVKPLYLRRLIGRLQGKPTANPSQPPTWASITQALIALGAMVGGARIFVLGVDRIADVFHVPHLALALLIAPVATELPEKFNSVIWISRRKDTLALGNLTGAMVFQSSFPVTIGLLLTPWRFTGAENLDSLVAALVALTAGSVLWLTVKFRGRLGAKLLLAQGAFFAGYVVFVLVRL
jgi:cation:H+ antiporter